MTTPTDPAALARLQSAFLASVLPKVVSHGRVYFRHLRSAELKEEYVAEMIALTWKWHLRLAERGKDAARFPTALASYAARAVRSGRRACGQERGRDALSPSAQRRHGFLVSALPEVSTLSDNPLAEALHDNTQTPPDEQCAFRVDFPAWRATHTKRDRGIIDALLVGGRTLEVAPAPRRARQGRHTLPLRPGQLRRPRRPQRPPRLRPGERPGRAVALGPKATRLRRGHAGRLQQPERQRLGRGLG